MGVDAMEVEKAKSEPSIGEGTGRRSTGSVGSSGQSLTLGMASSSSQDFDFTFPSTSSESTSSTTPTRRRPGAPNSLPGFPSSSEQRNPAPQIPLSPSPSRSPAPRSPLRSPVTSPPHPSPSTTRQPFFPIPMPQSFASSTDSTASPWHALAATSGAPTPSLESGPTMNRSSPHLGYPFERLNIGGSWSGANLGGDGAPDRRLSSEIPGHPSGASPSKGNPKVGVLPPTAVGGMNAEMLAKYRVKVSSAKGKEDGVGMDGVETRAGLTTSPVPKPTLPAALAKRQASLPKNPLKATLSPPHGPSPKLTSPLASIPGSSPSSSDSSRLRPLSTDALGSLLLKASALILDLRPLSSFHLSHLINSYSIPIPSTLLRRPNFTLQKVVQMLAPPANDAVSKWREMSDLILVDADSGSAPDGGILDGLAGKFVREGYKGQLWYVTGGHNAVQSSGHMELVSEEGEEESGPSTSAAAGIASGGLMAGRLGKLAFRHESTGSGRPSKMSHPGAMRLSLPVKTPGLSLRSDPFAGDRSIPTSVRGVVPMSDLTIGPYASSSMSSGSNNRTTPVKLQPANPFFDNIRQNLELSHGGITERIPLGLDATAVRRAGEFPSFLNELVNLSEKESADRLAEEFYRIELGEQKRLQGVMDFHSRGSGTPWLEHPTGGGALAGLPEQKVKDAREVERLAAWVPGVQVSQGDYFPFSITAGVERGTKNRYKNIWPYDFSRVRLACPTEDDSDYINASYVQPRGTARRYIATQGPLDATFTDFWTLVWEQDVRVIVMLTKQFEGGLLKCGNYWGEQVYGPLRLSLVSKTGGEDQKAHSSTGFDFGSASRPPPSADPAEHLESIKRVFTLSHEGHPQPPRKIVQIQCTAWPDFDVPDSPEVLLGLIREVDSVSEELGVPREDPLNQPPVLVHCSAGVGRTGSFIIVDAIVDALRKDRKRLVREASAPPPPSPGRSLRDLSSSSEPHGHRSSPSLINPSKVAGSSDSFKSVSFLSPLPSFQSAEHSGSPPTHFTVSPAAIAMSPAAIATPMSGSSNPSATSYIDAKAANTAAEVVRIKEEKMELDAPAAEVNDDAAHVAPTTEGSPTSKMGENFNTHRGSVAASVDSEEGWTRRPSLVSAYASSEMLGPEALYNDFEASAMTRSGSRHRTPSPISEIENPIASVLEGMRVQRMSLVQSLRQYLFVHRVIIQSYLSMIDEDRQRATSVDSEAGSASFKSTARFSKSSSSGPGTDDEGGSKRRASLTELRSDDEEALARIGASALSKRPSVKRMRVPSETAGATSASGSKDSYGRLRSRSKLSLSDAEGTGN